MRVEQGYEIDRPSLLYLQAEKRDAETSVHVGGKVQMVAKGGVGMNTKDRKIWDTVRFS